MTPGVTVNQSMDDRIKEFRSDPEKMNVTTKFVDEVVEKAKDEALKRMKEMEREGRREVQEMKFDGDGRRKRGRWHSRARGFFSRIFASLCFCSTETQKLTPPVKMFHRWRRLTTDETNTKATRET